MPFAPLTRFLIGRHRLLLNGKQKSTSSKLNVAQELSEFTIFLYAVRVSEAAVERIFSVEKFLDAPLCNALEDKVVQSALFVRFNLLHFGDHSLIPHALRERVKYMYHEFLTLGDPPLAPDTDPETDALRFWQV